MVCTVCRLQSAVYMICVFGVTDANDLHHGLGPLQAMTPATFCLHPETLSYVCRLTSVSIIWQ